MDIKETIRKLFLFDGLSDQTYDNVYEKITCNAKEKVLNKGEVLCAPGDRCEHMIIVLQGMVKSLWYPETGEEIASNVFTGLCVLLCIPCISQSLIRSYYVTATQTRLLQIPRKELLEAMDENPTFKDRFILHLCDISEHRLSHLYIIQHKRAVHRICSYLLEEYQFGQSLCIENFHSFEMLANYLNLTRPAFSRELHALERQGLVTVERRRIIINDLERLREIMGER